VTLNTSLAPIRLERSESSALFGPTMGLVPLTAGLFAVGASLGRNPMCSTSPRCQIRSQGRESFRSMSRTLPLASLTSSFARGFTTTVRACLNRHTSRGSRSRAPSVSLVTESMASSVASRGLKACDDCRSHAQLLSGAPRLALRPNDAALALGVSRSFFFASILPELRVVRCGRLRLVPISELERWLDRHAARALLR
jgi:hypothetical protein